MECLMIENLVYWCGLLRNVWRWILSDLIINELFNIDYTMLSLSNPN